MKKTLLICSLALTVGLSGISYAQTMQPSFQIAGVSSVDLKNQSKLPDVTTIIKDLLKTNIPLSAKGKFIYQLESYLTAKQQSKAQLYINTQPIIAKQVFYELLFDTFSANISKNHTISPYSKQMLDLIVKELKDKNVRTVYNDFTQYKKGKYTYSIQSEDIDKLFSVFISIDQLIKKSKYNELMPKIKKSIELASKLKIDRAIIDVNFNLISYYFNETNELEKVLSIIKNILPISEAIGDKYSRFSFISNLGDYYTLKDEDEKAFQIYIANLDYSQKIKCKKCEASAMQSIGIHYRRQNIPDESIDYFTKSLAIFTDLKLDENVANVNFSLGKAYYRKKKYVTSRKYFETSIKYYESIDSDLVTSIYTYLGNSYRDSQNPDYEKAKSIYFKSLNILTQKNRGLELANTYENIAISYYHPSDKYDYAQSIEYSLKAIDVYSKIGKNDTYIALNNRLIGHDYYSLKKYEKAVDYYNRSLELYEKIKDSALSDRVKDDIARSFMKLGQTEKAVKIYIDLFASEDSSDSAVSALQDIEDKNIIPQLMTIIKSNRNIKAKVNSVKLLSYLGDKSLAQYLIEIAKDKDADNSIREEAIYALTNLGDKSIIPQLLEYLEDLQLMPAAVSTLKYLNDPDIIYKLIDSLNSNSETLKLGTLGLLKDIKDKRAKEYLLPLLNDKSPKVRKETVYALRELNDKSIVENLIPLLKDESEDVRSAVVSTLGNIGDESLVSKIKGVLTGKEKDEWLGIIANLSAEKLKNKNSTEQFIADLKSDNPDTIRYAILRLNANGDKTTVAHVVPFLKYPDPEVRKNAISIVSKWPDKTYIPEILPLLKDKDPQIFIKAIKILGTFKEKSLLPELIHFIDYKGEAKKDEDEPDTGNDKLRQLIALLGELDDITSSPVYVRSAAIEAVAKTGDKSLIPAILKHLDETDSEVRNAVVNAIGLLGDKSVIPLLLPVLKDGNSSLQKSVINTLIQIGNMDILNDILPYIADYKSLVRETAQRAVLKLNISPDFKELQNIINGSPYWIKPELLLLQAELYIQHKDYTGARNLITNILALDYVKNMPCFKVMAEHKLASINSPHDNIPMLLELEDFINNQFSYNDHKKYRNALSLNYILTGKNYMALKKYPEARVAFKKANDILSSYEERISLYSYDIYSQIKFNEGRLYELLDQSQDAVSCYKDAINTVENSVFIKNSMENQSLSLNEIKEHALYIEYISAYENIIKLFKNSGDNVQAEQYQKKLKSLKS